MMLRDDGRIDSFCACGDMAGECYTNGLFLVKRFIGLSLEPFPLYIQVVSRLSIVDALEAIENDGSLPTGLHLAFGTLSHTVRLCHRKTLLPS